MKFSNYEIYTITNTLTNIFSDLEIYIPAKANFFLQKNIASLSAATQEIEQARLNIAKQYGILDETNEQYKIPAEKIEDANNELNELFRIEQELDIKTFSISDLGNIELTPAQMQAIMFMIED